MSMLVNCSNCRIALHLPPAATSISCAVCQAITYIAEPNAAQPPPFPPPYAPSNGNYCAPPPLYNQYYPPPASVTQTPSPPYNQQYPPPAPAPQAPYNQQYLPPVPVASAPQPPCNQQYPPPTRVAPAATTPSPYNYAPPGPPPQVHGHKRALIVGICYKNTNSELRGCINDAKCMKFFLINRFKFPEESIIMLTDEETDPLKRPTKHNIRAAMYWLVQGCQAGDSLVFHFSGHGSQKRNYIGDEIDGYDETILPLDYEKQGVIVDDEINAMLVNPLPRGVKLHAVIDACHSGTVMDLPYLCRMDRTGRYSWEDHRPPSGAWKGTSGGEVISFSGCDDDQTAIDTDSLSKVTATGAMTFAFIQAIEREQGTTYGSILNSMRSTIRSAGNDLGGDAVTALVAMLLTGGSAPIGIRQEPQLTANEPFDVYTKTFSL